MKLIFFLTFCLFPIFSCHTFAQQKPVTFQSLLNETANNNQLVQYPSPYYQQLEASSYNRASVSPFKPGWFADGDGSGYIKKDTVNGKTEYVIMEHQGPGCITRMWTPYFYYNLNDHTGPNISVYIDGSKKPVLKENFIELLTGKSFVHPPFANLTTRAGVCYLPVPFSKSCVVTLDQKPFYYCISYRAYNKGTKVKSFTMNTYQKSTRLMQVVAGALNNIPKQTTKNIHQTFTDIKNNDSLTMILPKGMHAIRYLRFKTDAPVSFGLLRNILLKITFDGQSTVWCPLGDFFCSADTINNFHTKFLQVNGNTMTSRWVMPYHTKATITVVNYSGQSFPISIEVQTIPLHWDKRSMYFHTNWCNYGCIPGNEFFDMNFIYTKGKGVIVGDALTVLSPGKGWWGEGDEKIYIDEKDIRQHFPSQFGTGTEDYYGWAGGVIPTGRDTFSIPFCSNVRNGNSLNPRGYNICVRNRILDAIPFNDALKFDMEASPGVDIRHSYNLLSYSMITYWYGLPGVICNREPAVNEVKRKLMTLSQINKITREIKDGTMILDDSLIRKKVNALEDLP
ncbi:MAG: DUF2961 domain-containing protein [Chitinophagaceae bacterium]|nr:MAG: DUF2961 domain-containing protein [Chitinophagaceae bacterium]